MSEQPPDKKSLSRWRRVLRRSWRAFKLVVLLALVLGIIYVVWTNHRGAEAAKRMIEELASRGLLIEPEPDIPDAENGTRLFLAAMKVASLDDDLQPKLPVVGWADWPQFGEGFTAEQVDALREGISRNKVAFELIEQAMEQKQYQHNLDPFTDLTQTMEIIHGYKNLARWLMLRSYLGQAEGDWDSAVEGCLGIFQISDLLRDERYILILLIRTSFDAMAAGLLEEMLSRAELDEEHITSMARKIRQRLENYHYAEAIRDELGATAVSMSDPHWHMIQAEYMHRQQSTMIVSLYESFRGEDIDEDELFKLTTTEWITDASLRTFSAWCPGYIQLLQARQLEDVLKFYDQIADPTASPRLLLSLSKRNAEKESVKALTRSLQTYLRSKSTLNAAEAALQVERFRLREGRWPDDLAEVFDQIPTDAYGQQLRMIRTDDDVRVYSIGENGVDEKGIHRVDEDSETDEEDDRDFLLLDPNKRNQPPTITELEGEDPSKAWESLRELLKQSQ